MAPRCFRLNAAALGYLDRVALAQITRQRLMQRPWDQELDAPQLGDLLAEHLPDLGVQPRKWIMDAMAVAAYQAQTAWPVVRLLVVDDAPQWTWLTAELALCWVHEGRHYKKLMPWVTTHRRALDGFVPQFWAFYEALLRYREQPTPTESARLAAGFTCRTWA